MFSVLISVKVREEVKLVLGSFLITPSTVSLAICTLPAPYASNCLRSEIYASYEYKKNVLKSSWPIVGRSLVDSEDRVGIQLETPALT